MDGEQNARRIFAAVGRGLCLLTPEKVAPGTDSLRSLARFNRLRQRPSGIPSAPRTSNSAKPNWTSLLNYSVVHEWRSGCNGWMQVRGVFAETRCRPIGFARIEVTLQRGKVRAPSPIEHSQFKPLKRYVNGIIRGWFEKSSRVLRFSHDEPPPGRASRVAIAADSADHERTADGLELLVAGHFL